MLHPELSLKQSIRNAENLHSLSSKQVLSDTGNFVQVQMCGVMELHH